MSTDKQSSILKFQEIIHKIYANQNIYNYFQHTTEWDRSIQTQDGGLTKEKLIDKKKGQISWIN